VAPPTHLRVWRSNGRGARVAGHNLRRRASSRPSEEERSARPTGGGPGVSWPSSTLLVSLSLAPSAHKILDVGSSVERERQELARAQAEKIDPRTQDL
jgi:hypothetical protein